MPDRAALLIAVETFFEAGPLVQYAAASLAPFKVPRYMEAVPELPHTPTGRIAKHQLDRERTAAEADFERRA